MKLKASFDTKTNVSPIPPFFLMKNSKIPWSKHLFVHSSFYHRLHEYSGYFEVKLLLPLYLTQPDLNFISFNNSNLITFHFHINVITPCKCLDLQKSKFVTLLFCILSNTSLVFFCKESYFHWQPDYTLHCILHNFPPVNYGLAADNLPWDNRIILCSSLIVVRAAFLSSAPLCAL